MKLKKVTALALCALLLSGCAPEDILQDSTGGQQETMGSVISAVIDPQDAFSKRDLEDTFEEKDCVIISLLGDSAQCDGAGVSVSGSTVTITGEGSYLLTGTLKGMVIVDAAKNDKIRLVLSGVEIESATSAAIYVKQADKVFITTAAGTENTVKNGGTFTAMDDNNIDAAIFSKDDLTLNGQGKLTVESPAGHGIVSKDDLVIGNGEYTVTSASHGLAGKDSVRIAAGTLLITAGKDGIHGENADDTTLGYVYLVGATCQIAAAGDGISTSNALRIDGGSYTIASGGGSENGDKDRSDGYSQFGGGRPGGWFGGSGTSSDTSSDSTSMKGIKAAGDMTICGGSFAIDAADDGLHTNASMTISGGSFQIATGDDGFHADENLTFTDGTVNITASYEGMEALHLTISGGSIHLVATDDGLNAAGGTDNSGFGGRDDMGGQGGKPDNKGDMPGMPDGVQGDMGTPPEMPGNGQGGFAGGKNDAPQMPGGQDNSGASSRMGGFGGFGGFGGMGGMSSGNGSILISGGELYIQASGDGIDANGTLEITGGNITICGPNYGDTASLDFDTSGSISGGMVIATGASSMAQTFSSAEQGVINFNAGSQKAGTVVTLMDASGNVLLTQTPALDYSMIILSSPELKSGETYTLIVGTTTKQVKAS